MVAARFFAVADQHIGHLQAAVIPPCLIQHQLVQGNTGSFAFDEHKRGEVGGIDEDIPPAFHFVELQAALHGDAIFIVMALLDQVDEQQLADQFLRGDL